MYMSLSTIAILTYDLIEIPEHVRQHVPEANGDSLSGPIGNEHSKTIARVRIGIRNFKVQ